jgi:DNA-binding CsgD family transcriptional regulator
MGPSGSKGNFPHRFNSFATGFQGAVTQQIFADSGSQGFHRFNGDAVGGNVSGDRPQMSEATAMATIPLRALQPVPARQTFFNQEARANIIDYSVEVENLATPQEVLNRLHDIVSRNNPVRVHGANRFPTKVGDWRRVELGKNAFIHHSVPQGWTEEWAAFVKSGHCLGLMTARMCLAPFTWKEMTRMLDPVGIDRWPVDLAHKHGMRDGYLCPVGGRWVVGFWSPKVLDDSFTQQARGLLYMAASAAAVRLERLVCYEGRRIDSRAYLTAREQAVLRHASSGESLQETARALGIGEETVRSHFKKAQTKLGTRNRTHTVAEAMRDLIIV